MPNEPVIIRVKKPVESSVANPAWYAYDRGRRIHKYLPTDEIPFTVKRVVEQTQRGAAYFHALLRSDGELVFGEEAPRQAWS